MLPMPPLPGETALLALTQQACGHSAFPFGDVQCGHRVAPNLVPVTRVLLRPRGIHRSE